MPNRVLRDWTDSTRIEQLDAETERFFIRLMMKADDFGIFHGDPRLLKAALFPLLPDVRLQEVRQWRDNVVAAGVCHLYSDERQREFVIIHRFDQRTRAKKCKYPPPDGRLADICPSCDSQVRTEAEAETESNTEAGTTPLPGKLAEIPSEDEVLEYANMHGITQQSARAFYAWMEFNDKWSNEHGKLRPWKRRLKQWSEEDKIRKPNGTGSGNKQNVDRNQGTANAGKANQYSGVGRVV